MQQTAIVIPCYNEEQRWSLRSFQFLLEDGRLHLILVDDGSRDQTQSKIASLAKQFPDCVTVLRQEINSGKSHAVRSGVLAAQEMKDVQYIGYCDADFAAPASEVKRFAQLIQEQKVDFLLGSRIRKLNTRIERSPFRHMTGRMIASLIDVRFKLGIYDTQCGLKFFTTAAASTAFHQPFVTRWLFDIEILLRLKNKWSGLEVPLQNWQAVPGSKLHVGHAFRILHEIYLLHKHYFYV
jgi:glycosyltransferase involved in cell wall biosynthesis